MKSRMKIKMACFFGILFCLLGSAATPPAIAREMISISGARVNMRSGSGKNAAIIWRLGKGYPLQVLKREGNWVKARDFEGDQGWIFRSLTGRTPHMIVKVRWANIRAKPDTRAKIVGKAKYGVVLRTIKHNRRWVKVRHENGLTGWVSRRLLWGW